MDIVKSLESTRWKTTGANRFRELVNTVVDIAQSEPVLDEVVVFDPVTDNKRR